MRLRALDDLLDLPAERVNDDRLYRALDRLLPHKVEIEQHLRKRLGELFALEYDLLLYDVTSTYFEGLAEANPLARRGHSRDHRPDCLQVCLALVVTREGIPLGYEVFAGNRTDVTTVEQIVGAMETRFGLADRVWVMDRGMTSAENVAWLQRTGRRYLIGAPRSELRRWRVRIAEEAGWEAVPRNDRHRSWATPMNTTPSSPSKSARCPAATSSLRSPRSKWTKGTSARSPKAITSATKRSCRGRRRAGEGIG